MHGSSADRGRASALELGTQGHNFVSVISQVCVVAASLMLTVSCTSTRCQAQQVPHCLQVLKLLTDVHVERSQEMRDNKPRFVVKLIFTFGENDFMQETELTKTYLFADAEESIAAGAEGCKITWKDGALLCHLI